MEFVIETAITLFIMRHADNRPKKYIFQTYRAHRFIGIICMLFHCFQTANYDFYHMLESECCDKVPEKYNFPVFEPSSSDSKEASIMKSSDSFDENNAVDDGSTALSYAPMTDNPERNIVSHLETGNAEDEISLSTDNIVPSTSSFAEQLSKHSEDDSPLQTFTVIGDYGVEDGNYLTCLVYIFREFFFFLSSS